MIIVIWKFQNIQRKIILCIIWDEKGNFRKTLFIVDFEGGGGGGGINHIGKNQSMGDSLILNGYLIFLQKFKNCAYIFKLGIYYF